MTSAAAAVHDAEAAPKGGRKKMLLLGVPVALLAVLAGLWFGGILPGLLGMDKPAAAADAKADGKADDQAMGKDGKPVEMAAKPPVFVDIPEIVANLNSPGRRVVYVKIHARLQLARAEDEAGVKADMPRLQDLFQTYLRETRPEELRGSVGTYRLREELLARANIAVQPAHVSDVLFTELLIQ